MHFHTVVFAEPFLKHTHTSQHHRNYNLDLYLLVATVIISLTGLSTDRLSRFSTIHGRYQRTNAQTDRTTTKLDRQEERRGLIMSLVTTVQQKVKMGTCLGYMHANANPMGRHRYAELATR